MTYDCILEKMEVINSSPVTYKLMTSEGPIVMNDFLGKKLKISYDHSIFCLYCGARTNKSFGGGYCYKHFISLPECDACMVKPELCAYHENGCRKPSWGEKHCLQPHIVYLANSSGLKVGITRVTQVPTRWIDQGASFAVPIFRVQERLHSGLIEKEIKKIMPDKTNWRKMLSADVPEIDLIQKRREVHEQFAEMFKDFAEPLSDDVYSFTYPVLEFPEKLKALSLDKIDEFEGVLLGIKGQYLIFDTGVFNVRRHGGYHILLEGE